MSMAAAVRRVLEILRDRTSRQPLGGIRSVGVRSVEVRPPSARDEGTWVFMTAAATVLCLIYMVAFERYGLRSPVTRSAAAATQDSLLPFQVLFRDLPEPEQRVFRQMQEGVVETVRIRGATGKFPLIEDVAAQGIPPFAPDVLDTFGLRWSMNQQGLNYGYVGVPADPASTAFLIRFQEPDPVTGERPAPGVVDEEHQLLPDNALLHATYWKRTGAADAANPAVILDPASQGWSQIRVRTLTEEVEAQQ